MGSPLAFITLISVTSSIFYLEILMKHVIEKNLIQNNLNVHYTLQHTHCKSKKKEQYELV